VNFLVYNLVLTVGVAFGPVAEVRLMDRLLAPLLKFTMAILVRVVLELINRRVKYFLELLLDRRLLVDAFN